MLQQIRMWWEYVKSAFEWPEIPVNDEEGEQT